MSATQDADGIRAWDASDRLARLALLVTGSPDRAYRLTREVLLEVGQSGQYVPARRKLLRKAVRTRIDPYTAGLLPGLGGLTPAARLWRRLMALPAAERALVVLTEAEGMADAVAGAVLGLPRGETEKTLERVRQALEAQTQLTEAERREVFEGPALLPASSAVPAQALARARRARRRARLLAGVAALAVVGGLATAVAALTGGEDGNGALPHRFTGEVTRLADPAHWPARGELLNDQALLRDAVHAWRAAGQDGDQTPTVVWAGRLDDTRRLVVLAGRNAEGARVVGALVDDGDGLRLAGATRPPAPTAVLALHGLQEDQMDTADARWFLVAPWVSELAVNDVGAATPTGAQEFRDVALHQGLSQRWDRAGDRCGRPVLRMVGADPADTSGAQVTEYALDAADDDVPVSLADAPPQDAAAQAGYFTVLHGLVPCPAADPSAGPQAGSSVALTDVSESAGPGAAQASQLHVRAVWAGRLPGGLSGQVLRVGWQVSTPDAGTVHGAAFAVLQGGSVRFSAARFGVTDKDLDTRVDAVAWPQAGRRPGFVVLAGGPGVARLDVQPRPKGFRPTGPVAFLPAPKEGQRTAVLGLDRTGLAVSAQPVRF